MKPHTVTGTTYGIGLSNAWHAERERLLAAQAIADPTTFRHLDAIGIATGMRCLEVGGGCGSVARFMAERVGTTGNVVVTDLDTGRLEGCDRHPIEAVVHDVTADPLDEDAFDIVHARLVLEHLPDRLTVLAKLVRSLRPGGRILIEDFDHSALGHLPPDRLLFVPEDLGPKYQRAYAAARALSAQSGVDLEFGRQLPVHLVDAGLTDVDAEVGNPLVRGGTPRAAYYALSLRQVRSVALGTGLVTEQDLEALIEALESPGSFLQSTPMVSAWGRRGGSPEAHPEPTN